ncbi:MAG: thiamine diphosphokinase [Elusimicrobia bacterium]|nr:thiamine diphosphokinase [Elusimicrobiota bacterium]
MTREKSRGACLIVLGGEIPDPAPALAAAARCREIICADGAVARAAALGLLPHFVVGDMDSLPAPIPVRRGIVFWCDFDPNRSDFQKCLDFAAARGFARVYVAGALGGRLDHAAVNLALAETAPKGMDVALVDRGLGRIFGPGRHRLKLRRGETFSLLALRDASIDVSGCDYPLRGAVLRRGSRGLSNRARGAVGLRVRRGRLWVFSRLP